MKTTTANGARLTLTVPEGALPVDTTVTITPVSRIGGVKGKLIGGVQLAPEGLVLTRAATLSISGGHVAGAVNGLSWFGRGKYAMRTRVTRAGTDLRFSVHHFSGAAGYDGPVEGVSSLHDAQRAFYLVLLAKLAAAQNTDEAFAEALALDLTWEYVFVAGDPGFMVAEQANVKNLLRRAFLNQVDRAYERCKTQHDVGKELEKLRGYARQVQADWAVRLLLDPQAVKDLVDDRLDKCARFELDFETVLQGTISGGDGGSGSFTVHVRVRSLPLKPSSGGQRAATKQIEYLTWSFAHADSSCSSTANGFRLGEPFAVSRLDIGETTVTMDVSPGKPIEIVHVNCPGGGADADVHTYESYFRAMHTSELLGDGLRIAGWEVPKGALYARKTYEQTRVFGDSDSNVTIDERTTFDLRHTPQR